MSTKNFGGSCLSMVNRVICVRTGDKYDQWYEDNLKFMVDKYSGLQYNEFAVIREGQYEGVFNKLHMFERFKDGQNIYFDLDVLIKGNCNHFLKKNLTVCHAWWRESYHTPLNSSIISWSGDVSHIHDKFAEDPEMYMCRYEKGMDQYISENFSVNVYTNNDSYCSIQTVTNEEPYRVYLFNQNYHLMKQTGWYSKYLMPPA